jgi:integrase
LRRLGHNRPNAIYMMPSPLLAPLRTKPAWLRHNDPGRLPPRLPGFREIVDLEWSAIDFVRAEMHVRRAKNGKPATHPIRGDELRELRKLRRESAGSFVFTSERGGPFTTDSFNWMVKRAGQRAKLPFQCHAHMLRHSAGYKLAGDGHDTRSIQDYLGHRDIRHTVRYTELSPKPFRDFWRD